MTCKRSGRFITFGGGLALALAATTAVGEDSLPRFAIDCGGGCAQLIDGYGLVSAPPEATFIITLVHLAPVPEEAFEGQEPVVCAPIKARVDTLSTPIGAQSLAVQFGERHELAAGEAVQIVQTVRGLQARGERVTPSRYGFSLRAEQPSSPCTLVASGFMFEDPATFVPCRLSVMTNVLPQLIFASGFEVRS